VKNLFYTNQPSQKNAIKFTDEGTIELGYTLKRKRRTEFEFYVKDMGIGIPENRQKPY
jgi:signal transduction histidine kinase